MCGIATAALLASSAGCSAPCTDYHLHCTPSSEVYPTTRTPVGADSSASLDRPGWLDERPTPANRREFQEDQRGDRHCGVGLHFWRNVPNGLATRRQFDRMGLRRNGQDTAAQAILMRRNKDPLVACSCRVDRAAPKRAPTARRLAALTPATWTRQADAMEHHGLDATVPRANIEAARGDIAECAQSRSTATHIECAVDESASADLATHRFAYAMSGFDQLARHGQEWDR